jgi:serine/threonine protein phosphatase PrpC
MPDSTPQSEPLWKAEENFAGSLIQGKRSSQQDAYAFFDPGDTDELLLVLADGMGGHQGGSVASQTAVHSFIDAWGQSGDAPLVQERMLDCLQFANRCIEEEAESSNGALDGMGCTLVAVLVHHQQLRWVSVGDSPLWLYRDGQLQRLNLEHSMRPILAARVAAGHMTEAQAAHHPERNHLLAAVNGGPLAMIDIPEEATPLQAGDIILAASDGLFILPDNRIIELLESQREHGANTLAQCLLEAVEAENHPKQDNTTVAIIQVPASS